MNAPSKQEPKIRPIRLYVWVLVALQALLLVSVGSAFLKLGIFNTIINFVVSVISTLLLMAFFMHETQARTLTRMVSALGFIWLALLIGISLTDFLTRIPVPAPW